jgi:hypothetical protein
MVEGAPQIFVALEQSALGAAVRQSTWLYPLANVGHIVSLAIFAGAVGIMDARLLGAFAATRPEDVIRPARRLAILGLLLMAGSGFLLFTAEASHVVLNRVFQIKAGLIGFGLVNALVIASPANRVIAEAQPYEPLPTRLRAAGLISLLTWIAVAACGRLIAYF